MAEQDELQIRVGLSVAGAEKVQSTAKAAEAKTVQVEQRVRKVESDITAAASRAKVVEKKVLKMGVAFAVGSLLETGLEAVIPTDDQNAISTLARIGKNVSVTAMMSPNAIGITLALLNGAIAGIQEDIKLLDNQIKQDKDEAMAFRTDFEKQKTDFNTRLDALDDKQDERIEALVQRGYLELRSGL